MDFKGFEKRYKIVQGISLTLAMVYFLTSFLVFLLTMRDVPAYIQYPIMFLLFFVGWITCIFTILYAGQAYLNNYLRKVLVNDNNFRNIRQILNSLFPYIEYRNMKLESAMGFPGIQIKYRQIKKLKLRVKQKEDKQEWKFEDTDTDMEAQLKAYLVGQLKFLYSKGFHVYDVISRFRGEPGITVTLRMGDYDPKQFHWFIMYMQKLLFGLEKRGRDG